MTRGMASKSVLRGSFQLNGIFAVNKPMGITSAKVVDLLKVAILKDLQSMEQTIATEGDNKQVLGEKRQLFTKMGRRRSNLKIGHGGTLDMNATGVLVIGCGSATKKLSHFLSGGKIYRAVGRLGRETDTMDASGRELETKDFGHVTELDIRDKLKQFTGDILQVPPVYSALKVGGERMSDLVARGVKVEPKPARPVQVFSLKCLSFTAPDFQIEVHCGGGVYVRKLIHDIGKSLGTCAYMTSLCRTHQGHFSLDNHALPQDRWTLQDILKALENARCPESPVR